MVDKIAYWLLAATPCIPVYSDVARRYSVLCRGAEYCGECVCLSASMSPELVALRYVMYFLCYGHIST